MKTKGELVKMIQMFIYAVVICCSMSAFASDMTDPLFKNGEALCEVVISESDAGVAELAQELSKYLSQIGGDTVPIAEVDNASTDRYSIEIRTQPESMKWVDTGFDGYVVNITPNKTVLYGKGGRGVKNAVYGFLTDFLNVHWYMPGELWEVVPQYPNLRLTVGKTIYKPGFVVRVLGVGAGVESIWATRNRAQLTGGFDIPYFPAVGHAIAHIISADEYGKKHPEYFSLIDGKRGVPEDIMDYLKHYEPCLMNADVIRITIDKARETFDNDGKAGAHSMFNYPGYFTFGISTNDNDNFCQCSECTKYYTGAKTSQGFPNYSNLYFRFANLVAKEVAKSHPWKTLGCLAYAWTVEPPDFPLENNIVVALTQDSSQYYDIEYKQRDREVQKQWLAAATHVIRYTYWGLGWFAPRYYPHIISEDIKQSQASGIEGIYSESYPFWAVAGPQYYLAASLLWNPEQKPDQISDEFFQDLFGPAALVMKDYFDYCEQAWTRPRTGKWFEGLYDLEYQIKTYPRDHLVLLRQCLETAKLQAETDSQRKRVEFFRRGFDVWSGILKLHDLRLAMLMDLMPETQNALVQKVEEFKTFKNLVCTDAAYGSFVSDYQSQILDKWLDELQKGSSEPKIMEEWMEDLRSDSD
jgi:Domain of unknown function (DUF4838)